MCQLTHPIFLVNQEHFFHLFDVLLQLLVHVLLGFAGGFRIVAISPVEIGEGFILVSIELQDYLI